MSEPTAAELIDRYRRAIFCDHLGFSAALLAEPGISFLPDPKRAGSAMALCYQIGPRLLVWSDPAVAERVADFAGDYASFVPWAEGLGFTFLAGSIMYVPGDRSRMTLAASDPGAAQVITLDREVPADVKRIEEMLATCSEDDIDEADIYIDDLDPIIRGAVDLGSGELVALSLARPFDLAPDFYDIGVITHGRFRRQGLSALCTRSVCDAIFAAGGIPLYRHDPLNTASAAVAATLGFTPAVELAAVKH